MFGQPRYVRENEALNAAFARRRPLVAVHRGTGLGSIAENTQQAVTAAMRQGADMVEIDVVQSTDGEFFLFHDGYEQMQFGTDQNIRTMTAEQIRGLRYRWHSDHPYGVSALSDVLNLNRDALFNVDRSWWFWEDLLPYLDRFSVDGRALLKSPVDDQWLEQLATHPTKYSFAPIVRSHEEALRILDYPDINTVGMELIAPSPDHEFADREYVDWLHSLGMFVLVNAMTMTDRQPKFCGWDDETSILESPNEGWDRLVSVGADIIQTDWPGILVSHLQTSGLPSTTITYRQ